MRRQRLARPEILEMTKERLDVMTGMRSSHMAAPARAISGELYGRIWTVGVAKKGDAHTPLFATNTDHPGGTGSHGRERSG